MRSGGLRRLAWLQWGQRAGGSEDGQTDQRGDTAAVQAGGLRAGSADGDSPMQRRCEGVDKPVESGVGPARVTPALPKCHSHAYLPISLPH